MCPDRVFGQFARLGSMNDKEPVGCLGPLAKLLGVFVRSDSASSAQNTPLPYRRKEWLLTKAERSLFGVLRKCVGDRYLVFSMVRLADIFYIPRKAPSRQTAFNRIQSKHIDFLLCEPDAVKPVLGIELDDSSHERSDRRKRDEFVDRVFDAAELPLLRIKAKRVYDPIDLLEAIENKLGCGETVSNRNRDGADEEAAVA